MGFLFYISRKIEYESMANISWNRRRVKIFFALKWLWPHCAKRKKPPEGEGFLKRLPTYRVSFMHTFANCHAMPARQDLVGLHSILVYKKLFWPNLTVFANPSRDFATTPPVGALGTLNRSVRQPYHLEVDTDYRSTQMSKWEEN
jgi:hypothetical protein